MRIIQVHTNRYQQCQCGGDCGLFTVSKYEIDKIFSKENHSEKLNTVKENELDKNNS